MSKVTFEDNHINVQKAIREQGRIFLHEAAGEITSRTKRNVDRNADTGSLKASYEYLIFTEDPLNEISAAIGSDLENAIWTEYGTGVHAEENKGRNTPWYIPVSTYTGHKKPTYKGEVIVVHGKNEDFYKTDGKKPIKPLRNAYQALKTKIKARAEEVFKEL